MIQTITKSMFHDAFSRLGCENPFSYDALNILYDYLEENDENYSLDVIELCLGYEERTSDEVIQYYSIEIDEDLDSDKDEQVRGYLNENTSLLGETAAGFVFSAF